MLQRRDSSPARAWPKKAARLQFVLELSGQLELGSLPTKAKLQVSTVWPARNSNGLNKFHKTVRQVSRSLTSPERVGGPARAFCQCSSNSNCVSMVALGMCLLVRLPVPRESVWQRENKRPFALANSCRLAPGWTSSNHKRKFSHRTNKQPPGGGKDRAFLVLSRSARGDRVLKFKSIRWTIK